MTEDRWLRSARPNDLLQFLLEGEISERKLRLYSVACARRVIRRPEVVQEAWEVIVVAERHADGQATAKQLEEVCPCRTKASWWVVADPDPIEAASLFTESGRKEARQPVKADLLREVFGNPFRKAKFATAWRTPTVKSLATAAYDERLEGSFDLDPLRLSILADALEDAGCRDEPILSHLRSAGPHVRGCWALDLCLKKR